LSCGIEALTFGSLMMFASGRLGQLAQLRQRVRRQVERREHARGQGDVARLDVDARLAGVGLQHRQQRVRGERRRLVGVRVDDLHLVGHQIRPSSRTASRSS
jgi:hypothetical protein